MGEWRRIFQGLQSVTMEKSVSNRKMENVVFWWERDFLLEILSLKHLPMKT